MQVVPRVVWLGRVLALVGLAAGTCYLVWRFGWSWQDSPWWLAWPMLAVELVGFLGGAALTWALWPNVTAPPPARQLLGPVDVVVRADSGTTAELRATLIAVRRLFGVGRVWVATQAPTAAVATAAADHRGTVLTLDRDDPAALRAALAPPDVAEWVLIVDAGDVPSDDLLVRCADVVDDSVGAVQIAVTAAEGDSAEHHADGRHELHPERAGLLPALGHRGVAVLTESAILVRSRALVDAARPGYAEAALWATTAALWAAGWRTVSSGRRPLVVRTSRRDPQDVVADRTVRARAARSLLLGRDGALRGRRWNATQRLAVAAWSVRPLSGFRRTVFMVVIAASLLDGHAPFRLVAAPMVVGFLPMFVLVPLGLYAMSGGAYRPGDRTRWSLRALGPAWRSLAMPSVDSGTPIVSPTPVFATHLAPAIVVVWMSVLVAMRGVSDRLTGALHTFSDRDLLLVLLASLWLLAMALDALRLLGVGHFVRRARRRPSAMPAEVGTDAGFVLDLSVTGAGVVLPYAPLPGERMTMRTSIPHSSGCTTAELPVVVRHVRRDLGGQWLVGVQFVDVPDAVADALAEYAVVDPAAAQLNGGGSGNEPVVVAPARNGALRMVALSGAVGAFASVDMFTGPGLHSRPVSVVVMVLAAVVAVATVFGGRHAHR